jgi:heat shock protein HslJ
MLSRITFSTAILAFSLAACTNTDKTNGSSTADSKDTPIVQQTTPVAPDQLSADTTKHLQGTWVLNYITGPRIAFDGLYPENKPQIQLDASGNLSGNTGCNSFSAPLTITGHEWKTGDITQTEKACKGSGEQVFLSTLKKVNKYDVTDGNTLQLMSGDIAVMRFTKKL